MTSIVDEEIMKSEDGQELIVPLTGEDHGLFDSSITPNFNILFSISLST
jgi:hypothetical protein